MSQPWSWSLHWVFAACAIGAIYIAGDSGEHGCNIASRFRGVECQWEWKGATESFAPELGAENIRWNLSGKRGLSRCRVGLVAVAMPVVA